MSRDVAAFVRTAAVLLACGTLTPPQLRAQAPDSLARAESACIAAIPAESLVVHRAYLVSGFGDSLSPARRVTASSIDLATQQVAQRVRALLGVEANPSAPAPGLTWRDVGRAVRVTVDPDGRMRWREDDDDEELARPGHAGAAVILRALDSLAAQGELLVLRDSTDRDTLRFTLHIQLVAEHDAVNAPRLRLGFLLFTLRSPRETWAREVPGVGGFRYPQRNRDSHYAGGVLATFRVRPDGLADLSSFRDVPTTGAGAPLGLDRFAYEEFVRAVRVGLPTLRFHPARLGGCAVTARVRMPVSFALTR